MRRRASLERGPWERWTHLTLPPGRGSVPLGGTSRSSFAKRACGNMPDATKLFDVLRLVLCTQPRSQARPSETKTPNAGAHPPVC